MRTSVYERLFTLMSIGVDVYVFTQAYSTYLVIHPPRSADISLIHNAQTPGR